MTTFDKREEGFEQLFVHDEELRFKAMGFIDSDVRAQGRHPR